MNMYAIHRRVSFCMYESTRIDMYNCTMYNTMYTYILLVVVLDLYPCPTARA